MYYFFNFFARFSNRSNKKIGRANKENEVLEEFYKDKDTSVSKIAKELKISRSTVYKYLNKNNLVCLKKDKYNDKIIMEYFLENFYKSFTQIANELKISRATLNKYIEKYRYEKIFVFANEKC